MMHSAVYETCTTKATFFEIGIYNLELGKEVYSIYTIIIC